MKKVGIITINDYNNYGNRLQNYALQMTISKLGYSTQTIINSTYPPKKGLDIAISAIRFLVSFIRFSCKGLQEKKIISRRKRSFVSFSKKHINETKYIIRPNSIPKDINDNFDFFVVGSDQVWNYHYRRAGYIEFLKFASPEKRIAYSCSFGISEIENEFKLKIKEGLSGITYLSVRENSGSKIVKDLMGIDVPVLLDPVFLLTIDDWQKIIIPSNIKPNRPYILHFFIGDVPTIVENQIETIAEQYDCDILRLNDLNFKELYSIDPSQFLFLLSNASLIITDSFHCTAFSILFQKPFLVTERNCNNPSMFTRLHTMLDKFRLCGRIWRNQEYKGNLLEINYSHINDILEVERSNSFDFLSKALGC